MGKTVIIGGGMAGLSAGIYTLLSGGEAVIIESHSITGGNLTGWQRGEYHIDNCIHWLTGTSPETDSYKMWCDLGALGGIPVHQGETLYTFSQGRESISLSYDLDKTEEDMLRISPADKGEIKKFISAVRGLKGIIGIEGAGRNEKLTGRARLKILPRLLSFHTLSIGRLAAKFKSPTLRGFIRCFLGDDFSALTLIVIFATFTGGNGGIPEGGSRKMAERVTQRFLNLGGRLMLGRPVAKINLKGKRAESVSLSDGTRVACDSLIITPDPKAVFGRLIKADIPYGISRMYRRRNTYRFSSIHAAFSVDSSALGFTGDLIIPTPHKYRSVLGADYLILREFSHEGDFAPKGKTVLQAMCFLKENDATAFIVLRRSYSSYRSVKQRLSEVMAEIISESCPTLKDSLTYLDSWTPATYNRYTGSVVGSYMSFIMPAGMIPFRSGNKLSGYENIYLATQWANAPGGLPIAAAEGKRAALLVAKETARAKSVPEGKTEKAKA